MTWTGWWAIQIQSITDPANGFANINGDEIFYAPTSNYCNDGSPTDDFTYTLVNGSSASVRVTVNCIDDVPIAVADIYSIAEDTSSVFQVLNNDFDNDSPASTMTIVAVTQPANGSVSHDGSEVTYVPDADYCNDESSNDEFTYTLNGGRSASVTVKVNCVDDPPVAQLDAVDADEDVSILIDVTANDTDVDGGTLAITGFTQPGLGTVVEEAGSLRYTPATDRCFDLVVPDTTFSYTITGGDSADVEIRLFCVNDQPDFMHMGDVVTEQAQTATINGWAFDFDFGASNENSFQQVLDFHVSIASDSAGVLSSVDVTNAGDLLFTTSGQFGVAIVDVVLQDDGGTNRGGVDLSPLKTFAVIFDDTIYADGFEQAEGVPVQQQLHAWRTHTGEAIAPEFDPISRSVWYHGFDYRFAPKTAGDKAYRWLLMWLREVHAYVARLKQSALNP